MKITNLLFAFLCIAVPFFGQNCAYAQQRDVAGTYEVILCHGDCDFDKSDRVVVKGYFVLFNQPIDKETLRRSWADFEVQFGYPDATACFSLKPLRNNAQTFAGIIRNGTTSWKQRENSNSIEFNVYRSADGFCDITGDISGGLFKGKATTRHMGRTTSDDTVLARRIGNPDLKFCIQ
jgi:hypothetical protein